MKTPTTRRTGRRAAPEPVRHPRGGTPDVPVGRGAVAKPGEVRIIGGQWKRSKLTVVDLPGLRPTPDRVRETLFNWLGQDLTDWVCLDAFAGTGALGFEAASRGAGRVRLIERESRLVTALLQAKEKLKAEAVEIVRGDALAIMAADGPGRYDLVFIDPPFAADLFEAALKGAAHVAVSGGYIYLEANRAFDAAALAPFGLELHRDARAGTVHAHLLRKNAE